ncbi:MAG: hypothetical protein IJ764_03430 [Bacteroidales bacterium]|nr:hypothetical protein [Bacteroidales bacterium]
MKNIFSNLFLAAVLLSFSVGNAYARECTECKKTAQNAVVKTKAAVCKRAQSTAELSVNNVRALINGYGNMWFDGSVAQYHIPKGGNTSPLYCAALWIGGTDVNDQLRIAALTFGNNGDDFWPGPLQLNTAYVSLDVCNQFDKHYMISKQQVSNHMSHFRYTETGVEIVDGDFSDMDEVIANWPAHGNSAEGFSKYLAPFYDADGDGEYDPTAGDYPYYDFDNELCPQTWKANHPGQKLFSAPTMETKDSIVTGGILSDQVLKGDETIWWVFNDMGNVHTETNGQPIGLEIRAQAFGFATNDEINNMTFYSYEIINRSTYTLKDTYFSQWVDPDLGYAYDDYVGCDVKRGLGYCYNGDESDGPGSGSYSGIPPAVGIDFFQGPYMDPDGKDNPKLDFEKLRANPVYLSQLPNYLQMDSAGNYVGDDANGNPVYDTFALTQSADLFYPDGWYFKPGDTLGNCAINGVNFGNGIPDDERFGMRRFVYYNNSLTGINSEPTKATDFYNYLRGRWKNGQRMTFGGSGTSATGLTCDFMFPGNTDPLFWGTNGVDPGSTWTEVSAGNQPGDRRFMQSAGPFTLKPGALNYITVGIPFAQASSGNAWSSVELLREIDDICQALFENCFEVLDGPEAPTVVVQELSNEIILYLTYSNTKSNNYNESYEKLDISIPTTYTQVQQINGVDSTVTMRYTDLERSYVFEGYQIYQLKDANASVSDIGDVSKARLVAQCDIQNYYDSTNTQAIARLINFETNSSTGIMTGKVEVDGANAGIQHVFRITTDQFAQGTSNALVNNKEYYYVAIAYAQNRYKPYSQTEASYLDGQKQPYLAGRKNEWGDQISPVTAMPHDPSSENGGTVVQSEYAMRPQITRIEGFGNGGNLLALTDESIEELMGPKGVPGMQPGKYQFSNSGVITKVDNPCIIVHPEYKQDSCPVDVKVIDPLNVKAGKFIINFVSNGSDVINDESTWYITNAEAGKPVYENGPDTIYSDFAIGRYNEQLIGEVREEVFIGLGISVSLKNADPIATDLEVDLNAGAAGNNRYTFYGNAINSGALLGSSISYADPTKQWLFGLPDNDNSQMYNWIRAGMQFSQGTVTSFLARGSDDIALSEDYLDEDYYRQYSPGQYATTGKKTTGVDRNNVFEDAISGTWTPYGLVSTLDFHPGFNLSYFMPSEDTMRFLANRVDANTYNFNRVKRSLMNNTVNSSLCYNDFSKLPSVRVVFTSDTSKWTRCPVLEMCEDYTQSEGNARKFQKRKHLSVDKLGHTIKDLGIEADTENPNNPAYIDAEGMGWFPGYAISLATGERLNVMFGEDSRYIQFNGRDMMWNPVDEVLSGTQNYVLGGRHFVYVMNATKVTFPNLNSSSVQLTEYQTPGYDAGRWANTMLGSLDRLLETRDNLSLGFPKLYRGVVASEGAPDQAVKPIAVRDSASLLFASTAWVTIPLVDSRYSFYYPGDNAELNANSASNGIACDITVDLQVNMPYGRFMGNNGVKASDCNEVEENNNFPRYMFEIGSDMATLTHQADASNSKESYQNEILDKINVVPNPYYSYSTYETLSQLETKVRFVNVPGNTVISIYTVDGTLVRKLGPTPVDASTYDWDLHNHNGIPIAGGMYLIHFNVPGVGERVVKWFGTMRPVDLNSFQF